MGDLASRPGPFSDAEFEERASKLRRSVARGLGGFWLAATAYAVFVYVRYDSVAAVGIYVVFGLGITAFTVLLLVRARQAVERRRAGQLEPIDAERAARAVASLDHMADRERAIWKVSLACAPALLPLVVVAGVMFHEVGFAVLVGASLACMIGTAWRRLRTLEERYEAMRRELSERVAEEGAD